MEKKTLCFDIDSIKEFVDKQKLSGNADNVMQINCMFEELGELEESNLFGRKHKIVQEIVDTLVTIFVYAEMNGLSSMLSKEFDEKMAINVKKPVRTSKGIKVKKQ